MIIKSKHIYLGIYLMKMKISNKYYMLIFMLIVFSSNISIENKLQTIDSIVNPATIGIKIWFYEHIQIHVYENGSILLSVESLVPHHFFDISDINKGLLNYGLRVWNDGIANLGIEYDLEQISSEEAEFYADKLCKRWTKILGGHSKLLSKKRIFFTSPLSGKIYNRMYYRYIIENLDISRAINLFMQSKPKEGFLTLIDRDNANKFWRLFFEMITDDYGNVHYRLMYQRRILNYYNYKADEIFIFNLFDLFNFTGPLIANTNSFASSIWIFIYKPAGLKFIILDAKIPEKMSINTKGRIINIENPPFKDFLAGEKSMNYTLNLKL